MGFERSQLKWPETAAGQQEGQSKSRRVPLKRCFQSQRLLDIYDFNIDHNKRDLRVFGLSLTCVHLVHAVEEVIWSARDAVAAHTQAAVGALIPGVVGPAEKAPKGKDLGYKTLHNVVISIEL